MTENLFIPLQDGRRLSARLWLPENDTPLPAVLEYMPYRKRDATRPRDEPIHAWFAANGYAAIRVDMHGSGDSDGLLRQEFQKQEQDDALEIIAWIAAQPWCDGAVAMLGKSWGGFSALQAAMRRPPALKAIIAVCAADNRYDQSLHYTGGALLNEQLWWSDVMMLFNMRPPDPEISGDSWLDLWKPRLADIEPWIGEWLNHQRRDEFWQHGSVSDAPSSIQCPVFAVGGWADYISRSVPRLMASLSVPRWGLVGPWGHHYPQDGIPGPAIGFMAECKAFLDTTLKSANTYSNEPRLRAWIADWHPPGPNHTPQSGKWVAEREWPSPRITPLPFFLTPTCLSPTPGPDTALSHRSPQSVGLCSPEWLSQGAAGEAPLDQRADDGKSLCFDTPPLETRLEILGSTILELDLASDQPVALLAARLCDIAPDGTSLRVSLGILNLTHRDSDASPEPLTPGRRTRIRLTLPETGHAFAPGHRIRLALSTAFWPIAWPAPFAAILTFHLAASRILLPVRPPDPADATLRPFAAPDGGPPTPLTILEPATVTRTLTHDLMTGTHMLDVDGNGGFLGPGRHWRLDDTGTILGHRIHKRCTIADDDPLSARIDITQRMEFERDDWRIRLETATRFSATATDFVAECEARAWHNDAPMLAREWRILRKRDLA